MEKFGKICKEYVIKEISDRFKKYPNYFVTTFSQVEVGEIEKLRKSIKKDLATYMVVKNSMLKLALEASAKDKNLLADFSPLISGTCGILFSKMDPIATARLLVQFTTEHESFKVQGGFMDGENISSDAINLLAKLPPRDTLLAMAVAGIKAPISGFVGLMSNVLRNLVGVLDAIGKKKGEETQA